MTNDKRNSQARKSPSRHENVELWCDTCCCEPEPRWQALADEMEREKEQRDQAEHADPPVKSEQ